MKMSFQVQLRKEISTYEPFQYCVFEISGHEYICPIEIMRYLNYKCKRKFYTSNLKSDKKNIIWVYDYDDDDVQNLDHHADEIREAVNELSMSSHGGKNNSGEIDHESKKTRKNKKFSRRSEDSVKYYKKESGDTSDDMFLDTRMQSYMKDNKERIKKSASRSKDNGDRDTDIKVKKFSNWLSELAGEKSKKQLLDKRLNVTEFYKRTLLSKNICPALHNEKKGSQPKMKILISADVSGSTSDFQPVSLAMAEKIIEHPLIDTQFLLNVNGVFGEGGYDWSDDKVFEASLCADVDMLVMLTDSDCIPSIINQLTRNKKLKVIIFSSYRRHDYYVPKFIKDPFENNGYSEYDKKILNRIFWFDGVDENIDATLHIIKNIWKKRN